MLQENKSEYLTTISQLSTYVDISKILIVEKRANDTSYFYSKTFLGQLVFMGYQTKQKKPQEEDCGNQVLTSEYFMNTFFWLLSPRLLFP